ncbi:hypothetical protein ACFC8N_39080 [Streptomyces sp. NPDC055966]|uniref:P-type ATPase n=1 Tax=Streptomyces sp. NPDC055966 TaxID=3345669 RepID=UPI0035DA87C3
MGTDVVAGTGKAVVCVTRTATEFGRIFRLTAAAPRQKTPLQRQAAVMARRVAGVALATEAALFAVRLPSGQPLADTFVFSLGAMVALVREDLPVTLSVSLAIAVRRMARRHPLVKQLWANGMPHAASGGYAPVGKVADAGPVRELLRTAALCSNARPVPPGRPVRVAAARRHHRGRPAGGRREGGPGSGGRGGPYAMGRDGRAGPARAGGRPAAGRRSALGMCAREAITMLQAGIVVSPR